MLLLAATAMALAVQLPPAAPPRDQPRLTRSEARDTATIRGLVTDRESGAPVSDVLVLVVPVTTDGDMIPAAPEQRRRLQHSRRTGADGSYEIRDIPPGSYSVTFVPSDAPALHLTQYFGDDGPVTPLRARPPARLTLRAGEAKNDVSAALSRGLAIEGRVIDERGEPVANADVIVRVADVSAHVAAAGRPRVTDDRGAFRAFGLAAGGYRVCAVPGPESVPTVGNTDRLVGACHPEETENGRSVTLSSRDVSGIVIQLRRSRTFMVKGIAIDSSGAPIERGHVNLMSAGATVSPSWNIDFTGGGTFTGRSVPPGDYLLLVWAHHDFGSPDARNGETGYVRLRVEAADLDGVIVTNSIDVCCRCRSFRERERPSPTTGASRWRISGDRDC
jgi:Carboxypeptidase regulatory-like domain